MSNAQLEDLFERWRRLRDQGQPTPPEQLCLERPEWLPPLRERISAFLAPGSGAPAQPTLDTTRPETPIGSGSTIRTDMPPGSFNGYRIQRVLGRGGMGVVYQARHPQLDLDVALKTMRGEADSPAATERFLREARAVALLNHPNIVRWYDAGYAEGSHFYTMALMPGGSLKDHRQSLVGDARRVAAIMEKVARGMQHAHEHGILHRDLKPGNILLDARGEPLVSDFGLAKFMDSSEDLTASSNVLGTVPYMAPELLSRPVQKASPASDIWALGVIMYELLTGRRPFIAEEPMELLHQVAAAEPPAPRTLNPDIDRALQTIVLKCLEKTPAVRYRSAGELADDLGRWLRGERIGARPQPWPMRMLRRVKRRPVVYTLTLAAAVAAAVGLTLWLAGPPADEGSAAPPQPQVKNDRQDGPANKDPKQPKVQDPETALVETQKQLARGEKVELVGLQGPPRWFRWSQTDGTTGQAKDGTWLLDSRNPNLMVLMPDPSCEHFLLKADLRQHETFEKDTHGVVGLFVGGQKFPAPPYDYISFNSAFGDMGLYAGKGELILYAFSNQAGQAPHLVNSPYKWDFPAAIGDWHTTALEVHPDRIIVYFDKLPPMELSAAKIEKYMTKGALIALNEKGMTPPTFGPRHACGIFVRYATVSVRNVTITPLNP
jgi:tRNA A-37 threonylcarbamoyl transferase component Bud32